MSQLDGKTSYPVLVSDQFMSSNENKLDQGEVHPTELAQDGRLQCNKVSSEHQKSPSICLGFVGDVRATTDIAILKDENRKRWLLSLSDSVDLAFANLEAAVTRSGAPAEKLLATRSDPGLFIQLRDCGFNVFTLANNHIMDYGPQGLADTLMTIDNIGLARVGAGLEWFEAVQPLIVKLPGNFSKMIQANGIIRVLASEMHPCPVR